MCNDLLVVKCKTTIDSGQFLNQQNHSWGRLKNCSSIAELATKNPQSEDAIAADDALLQYWGSLARTMRPGMTGITVLLSWEKQGKHWEIGCDRSWNADSSKVEKSYKNPYQIYWLSARGLQWGSTTELLGYLHISWSSLVPEPAPEQQPKDDTLHGYFGWHRLARLCAAIACGELGHGVHAPWIFEENMIEDRPESWCKRSSFLLLRHMMHHFKISGCR